MTIPFIKKLGDALAPYTLVLLLLSAVLTVSAMTLALIFIEPPHSHGGGEQGEFPAQELRVADVPPSFSFVNQEGTPVTLESLRGKIVMITGVFATCHTACPTIIEQAKSAVESLTPEQRAKVAIVAITLDPENDTQEKRAMTAEAHDLEAPLFNYVNGDDPETVASVLDDFKFARGPKDPETGVMGHVNMYVLIDKTGKIAYRLTLGSAEEHWVSDALKVLVDEA